MTFSFDFNDAPTRPALSEVTPAEWDARCERLRQAINGRAPEFVRMLLPAARIQGHDARIGSLAGEPGESVSIEVSGPNVGVWHEFNGKEGGAQKGDLIQLWMELERRTFAEAVDDLEKWCGLQPFPTWNTRVKARAESRAKEHAARPAEALEGKWETVKTYRYLSEEGALLAFVHRQEHTHQRDLETGKRKKKFLQQRPDGSWASPEGLRPLYHLPEIKEAKTVVLVEGEKCADALWDLRDIPATTAMAGAGAPPEKTDWRPLAGKRVIIWPDNDEGGLALPSRVRPHLEQLGCEVWVVPIPADKPKKWDSADAIEEGEDTDALLSAARPEGAQVEAPRKLRILSEDDLDELPEPSWLVDSVLPDGALVMLYGAPGSRKSFAAVDLAMAVASGRPWHGREVSPGYALYVAGEGGAGIAKRLKGWRLSRSIEKTRRIGILPAPVAMPTGQLDELLAEVALLPERPRLIILDTVARCFGAGNENDQKDMNAFVAACDKLKAVTGATVVVVHHSGKDSERGARGSSVLPGAVDVSIQVVRKEDVVTLRNRAPFGKMKDAEEFEDIALVSSQIEVGIDSRGRAITTLVLSAHDGPVVEDPTTDEHWEGVRRTKAQEQAQLGALQMSVLSQLRESAAPLGQMSLSKMTKSDVSSVGRALKRLVERGFVREETKVEGRVQFYSPIEIEGLWPVPAEGDDGSV